MSYDLYIDTYDGVAIWSDSLHHSNITYNINRLLRETTWVGLTLKDMDGLPVDDVIRLLLDVAKQWRDDSDHFKQFEVAEWGSLAQCMVWIQGLTYEMLNYSKHARLRVSA